MRFRERDILLAVMAALPVLHLIDNIESAFFFGSLILAATIFTALIFTLFRFWFPSRLLGLAWMLWLITLIQCAFYLKGLSIFWSMSVAVLFPYQEFKKQKVAIDSLFFRLLVFGIVLALTGACREAGQKLGFDFFVQPAGCFLVFAGIAFFLKRLIVEKA